MAGPVLAAEVLNNAIYSQALLLQSFGMLAEQAVIALKARRPQNCIGADTENAFCVAEHKLRRACHARTVHRAVAQRPAMACVMPIWLIVSSTPGMEMTPPERAMSSRGFSGSPSFLPVRPSSSAMTFFSASLNSVMARGGF